MASRGGHRPRRADSNVSSIRSSEANVFSDDYALHEYGVRDGDPRISSDHEGPTSTSMTPQRSASSRWSMNRRSMSFRRIRLSDYSSVQTPTLSRNDDMGSVGSRRTTADLSRTTSNGAPSSSRGTTSTAFIPRAQSPYQGATGPSQPYGMYAQDSSFSRTPSVATTMSTARRPERSYSGPAGPTQPYGMYSQNTLPEDDDVRTVPVVNPAIADFPGQRQNYRRRLGPDGEDADDLIGPDGYTEPLPPYTRYANGIPPKRDPDAVGLPNSAAGTSNSQGPAPVQEQVRYLPAEYYVPPTEQQSPTGSNPFDDRSAQASSTTAVESTPKDEDGSFKERIKEKTTRKVCCGLMPCWLFLLVLAVVCVAVIVGGVIGGAVAHHSARPHPTYKPPSTPTPAAASVATVTATTVGDAVPIATPTDLPPLPTGSFSLVLDNPSIASNSCLVKPEQANAWDCSTGANLNITISTGSNKVPSIDLEFEQSYGPKYRYGAQPPELGGMANLRVVQDRDEWNKGAAYFFMKTYNKTVIVRDSDFPSYPNGPTGGSHKQKRWAVRERDSHWTDAQYACPNDKPWFCFWNNTVLEGFIYVTQNEDIGNTANNAASTDLMPLAAATSAMAASAVASNAPARRDISPPTSSPYPKVVKVEERRPLARIAPAYCQQMIVLDNGQLNQIGTPVSLDEVEPPVQHLYMGNDGNGNGGGDGGVSGGSGSYGQVSPPTMMRRQRGAGANTNCMCEWQN